MNLNLKINGRAMRFDIRPDTVLVDALRERGFLGVKKACGEGACGACTVLLDGSPILACILLAAKAESREVTTIEGLGAEAEEAAKLLSAQGAEQCGFCSPGLVVTAVAMKRELAAPTKEGIRRYLAGNLCRCSGYAGQERALFAYMGVEE
jgi:carbon-monoxide dehydrogenase small subunit